VAAEFLALYTLEIACRILIVAQAGCEVILVKPVFMECMDKVQKMVTSGLGPQIAWPALLRRLDRADPSYKE
jgi:hypothetical protein